MTRILSFRTPLMDATGLVRFPWRGPGDVLPLEMEVDVTDVTGGIEDVRAEVWTNANESAAPERFRAVAMKLVDQTPWRARFVVDLPIRKMGNYRAVGRVSVAGGPFIWMSDSGVDDIRFRPRLLQSRGLLVEEVSVAHVNWDPFEKMAGTFADMMDGDASKYTLRSLAERGVDAVSILSPFDVHLWDQRPAGDDFGSPYAVKDFFAIRAELSRAARVALMSGAGDEEVREEGLAEVRAFIEQARTLGIKVLLDVALNHVGHEHRFRDVFVTRDGVREVRADFAQVRAESQREIVPRRLDEVDDVRRASSTTVPVMVMERMAPWMYADRQGDPKGARSVDDKIAGGYGEWPDTAQLNHGRVRVAAGEWRDCDPVLPVHRAVLSWLERVVSFWAVDIGVDGFHLAHLSGLPPSFLEGALNRVQAAVERPLFIVGEDVHTSNETRHFVDAIQGGFFRDLLRVTSPADFIRVLDDPWFNDVLALSTHDEQRPVVALGDDARAYARLQALLMLAGGPASLVAGDSLCERAPLPFKQARGIEALRSPTKAGRAAAELLAKVGRARRTLPPEGRVWLRPLEGDSGMAGAPHRWILAMQRGARAFVVANFSPERAMASFALPDHQATAAERKKSTREMVRALHDLLDDRPAPATCAILGGALTVTLEPYEVRALLVRS